MCESKDFWESRFKAVDLETYDFSKSKPDQFLADFCEEYLDDGDNVLDLGCGGGRNAHYLAKQGYTVYGLDIAMGAIDVCKFRFDKFNLSGTFKQGTFDDIPFPDDTFAAVVCIAAFDHVTFDEAHESIQEIRRVLSEDGVILMTFDPPHTDEDIIDETEILPDGTLRFIRGDQKGMLFHRYKDEEIKELLGEENIISFDHDENGNRIIVSE